MNFDWIISKLLQSYGSLIVILASYYWTRAYIKNDLNSKEKENGVSLFAIFILTSCGLIGAFFLSVIGKTTMKRFFELMFFFTCLIWPSIWIAVSVYNQEIKMGKK
jgi:hypothetical protein